MAVIAAHLRAESFWWCQCSVNNIVLWAFVTAHLHAESFWWCQCSVNNTVLWAFVTAHLHASVALCIVLAPLSIPPGISPGQYLSRDNSALDKSNKKKLKGSACL